MATYDKKASNNVGAALHEEKAGTLKSGSTGKTVTSRKQAIAIGLSEARRAGAKVPAKKTPVTKTVPEKPVAKKTARKAAGKKAAAKRPAAKKTAAKKTRPR